jgi:hypothetical protein
LLPGPRHLSKLLVKHTLGKFLFISNFNSKIAQRLVYGLGTKAAIVARPKKMLRPLRFLISASRRLLITRMVLSTHTRRSSARRIELVR